MPKRVQLSRAKGWRMPPGTVKVDRTTRWGNPFRVVKGPGHKWFKRRWRVEHEGQTIHERQTEGEALNWSLMRFAAEVTPILDLKQLRGKDLACWCRPGTPCHADILLELANQDEGDG